MNNDNHNLLLKIIPKEISSEVFSSEINFSKTYKRDVRDELRELKIHLENANDSGLVIKGGQEVVCFLSKTTVPQVTIFAGKNKHYFFKLYIKTEKQKSEFYILIKRKFRSKEEISTLSSKLGFKNTSD